MASACGQQLRGEHGLHHSLAKTHWLTSIRERPVLRLYEADQQPSTRCPSGSALPPWGLLCQGPLVSRHNGIRNHSWCFFVRVAGMLQSSSRCLLDLPARGCSGLRQSRPHGRCFLEINDLLSTSMSLIGPSLRTARWRTSSSRLTAPLTPFLLHASGFASSMAWAFNLGVQNDMARKMMQDLDLPWTLAT